MTHRTIELCAFQQCVAVCCSMLQHVAVCCSMLQHVAVCCSASKHMAPDLQDNQAPYISARTPHELDVNTPSLSAPPPPPPHPPPPNSFLLLFLLPGRTFLDLGVRECGVVMRESPPDPRVSVYQEFMII